MHKYVVIFYDALVWDECAKQFFREQRPNWNAGCAECGCSEFHPNHFV